MPIPAYLKRGEIAEGDARRRFCWLKAGMTKGSAKLPFACSHYTFGAMSHSRQSERNHSTKPIHTGGHTAKANVTLLQSTQPGRATLPACNILLPLARFHRRTFLRRASLILSRRLPLMLNRRMLRQRRTRIAILTARFAHLIKRRRRHQAVAA